MDFEIAKRSHSGEVHARCGTIRGAILRVLLVGGLFLAVTPWAVTQEANEEARFENESLRLRAALHRDPNLDKALDALVQLYFEADRSAEIVELYQNHLSKYPDDTGAQTVLDRILKRLDELLKDPGPSQEESGGDEREVP